MKRGALFGAVTIAYLLAAWMVAPGFYDGFTPQQPYNWVCPPPQVGHNVPPLSGHLDIKVIGGVSDANSAFTNDGQIVVGFLPGAFDATGKTTISVDINPVSPCPQPPGLMFVTNTYLITASAPLVKKANLVLRYSDLVPAPSYVYNATSVSGLWASTRGGDSAPFTIQTTFSEFGYFAAGYPSSTQSSGVRIGGGQVLPIVVAVLIVAVLVAGIPLEVMRRRRGGKQPQEVDDEAEEES